MVDSVVWVFCILAIFLSTYANIMREALKLLTVIMDVFISP
jgi:hypothetical protein